MIVLWVCDLILGNNLHYINLYDKFEIAAIKVSFLFYQSGSIGWLDD